jgi:hypothetical protein
MNRKAFIESQGATCKNWTYSWSFVNHERKFVIFGAWDIHVEGDTQIILSETWQLSDKGRIQPGYTQAIEHIRLIEEEGYQLKTFLMEFSDENMDKEGHGAAKIKRFESQLYSKQLRKVGNDWLAVDTPNEHKLARICWNSEGWEKPSGIEGKATNQDAYEYQNGYGHEEWLLDTTKLIDGYHYTYIQAIGSNRDKYIGDSYDISFYSINNDTKKRWWLGTIRNVSIVGTEESNSVYDIYKRNGWYDEMVRQLERVGANVKAFKKFSKPESFAAMKFKVDDLELLDEPIEFSHDDPAVTSNYYNLLNFIKSPELGNLGTFKFVAGNNEKKGKGKRQSTYRNQSDELDLFHNRIQKELFNHLVSIYGKDDVGTEISTGRGTRVDAAVQKDEKYTLYEIKTSNSVRQCIRDALGQLLEYAHFGNGVNIDQLVVVSPFKAKKDVTDYIYTLREKYQLPIVYRQFDLNILKLIE